MLTHLRQMWMWMLSRCLEKFVLRSPKNQNNRDEPCLVSTWATQLVSSSFCSLASFSKFFFCSSCSLTSPSAVVCRFPFQSLSFCIPAAPWLCSLWPDEKAPALEKLSIETETVLVHTWNSTDLLPQVWAKGQNMARSQILWSKKSGIRPHNTS